MKTSTKLKLATVGIAMLASTSAFAQRTPGGPGPQNPGGIGKPGCVGSCDTPVKGGHGHGHGGGNSWGFGFGAPSIGAPAMAATSGPHCSTSVSRAFIVSAFSIGGGAAEGKTEVYPCPGAEPAQGPNCRTVIVGGKRALKCD